MSKDTDVIYEAPDDKSIITLLKYRAPKGTEVEMKSASLAIGIEMLFVSLPTNKRRILLGRLNDRHIEDLANGS